jgi:hypothetical protein
MAGVLTPLAGPAALVAAMAKDALRVRRMLDACLRDLVDPAVRWLCGGTGYQGLAARRVYTRPAQRGWRTGESPGDLGE